METIQQCSRRIPAGLERGQIAFCVGGGVWVLVVGFGGGVGTVAVGGGGFK